MPLIILIKWYGLWLHIPDSTGNDETMPLVMDKSDSKEGGGFSVWGISIKSVFKLMHSRVGVSSYFK